MTAPTRPIAVSIPEAARLLGFGETYFRYRVLPDLRVIQGSRPRIVVADLEAWADEHKAPPTAHRAGFGVSASASPAEGRSYPRVLQSRPAKSGLAKKLLERASKSTPRRSKASA